MNTEIKNETFSPALNSYVEDLSGCIGKIIGFGELVGQVRVDFGDHVWRDLFTNQLRPAKYSLEQLEKMQDNARNLFECLTHLAYYVADQGGDARYSEQLKQAFTTLKNSTIETILSTP